MALSDQQFGRLEGKVDALVEQTAKTEERNSTEHAAVMRSLERVETKLDTKVDWTWMREQRFPERLGSLEGTRKEGSGAAKILKVLEGLALLALPIVGLLIGKGL